MVDNQGNTHGVAPDGGMALIYRLQETLDQRLKILD
jgi:hypothetical protein